MIYCVDIDGTICRTIGTDYENAEPVVARIEEINQLFDSGHEIVYFTARGSGSGINYEALTLEQFAKWGVKFTRLQLGKPAADLYIDNKGTHDSVFFSDNLGELHT